MKKIYLLVAGALLVFSTANAQTIFEDDMESHPLGEYYSAYWNTWSGTNTSGETLVITDEQAASGTKSGKIGPTGQDVVLKLLSKKTTGIYTAEWKMYIPTGKYAYYNFQANTAPGGMTEEWVSDVYANTFDSTFVLADSVTTLADKLVWTCRLIDSSVTPVDTVTRIFAYADFPYDTWFTVKQVMDLDNGTFSVLVDDVEGTYYYYGDNSWPGLISPSFGSIDFYSLEDTSAAGSENTYYIDDVTILDNATGIKDLSNKNNTISLYPNPSNGMITISAKQTMETVEIFNLLGQRVMTLSPNAETVKINTTSLTAGVYTAKVISKDVITSQEFVVK